MYSFYKPLNYTQSSTGTNNLSPCWLFLDEKNERDISHRFNINSLDPIAAPDTLISLFGVTEEQRKVKALKNELASFL